MREIKAPWNWIWIVDLLISFILLIIVFCVFFYLVINNPIQEEDPSSGSNFNEIIPIHFDINLTVDVDKRILQGNITYTLKALKNNVNRLILDMRDIEIKAVQHPDTYKDYKYSIYNLNSMKDLKDNQILYIRLSKKLLIGDIVQVQVLYSSKNGDAVNWLYAAQTHDKYANYMYTQCETIHCRTLVPGFDTPAVKSTFVIALTVNKGLVGVASGILVQVFNDTNTFVYKQDIPVALYLLAFAVGKIEYGRVQNTDRVGIYAEPSILPIALKEFEDTGKFLDIIESKLTPYPWHVYNILVLPNSFPYGGMENPYLTFANGALIVGDKSMEPTIAHEIVHSWFGNFLTCKNWDHFWLNEGFTMYGQRMIQKTFYGDELFNASAYGAVEELKNVVQELGPNNPLTSLVPRVEGINADDKISDIAYEKGYVSLYNIATIIGEDEMLKLLKLYISTYANSSVDSEQFRGLAFNYINTLPDGPKKNEKIKWDDVLYKPGMPNVVPDFQSFRITGIKNLAIAYLTKQTPDLKLLKSLVLMEKGLFIEALSANPSYRVTQDILNSIENDSNYTKSLPYSYSLSSWLVLNIPFRLNDIYDRIDEYLSNVGRMAYILSIYQSLVGNNYKDKAQNLFNKNKAFYHPICVEAIELILNGK